MDESFFQRWSRRKAEHSVVDKGVDETRPRSADKTPASAADMPDASLPTLEDVARLTRDSDYSSFLAKGVDRDVRRAAMKKLFADPHFNVMDGLDIYIDDYTKPSPLTPAMLAALQHTHSMFEAIAKDEREREERQKAQQQPQQQPARQELAAEGGMLPEREALPDQAQRGDDVQEEACAPEPAETQCAGSEISADEHRVLPSKETSPSNSIRHSG